MMNRMSMTEQKKIISIRIILFVAKHGICNLKIADIAEYAECSEVLIEKHFGNVGNIRSIFHDL